MNTLRCMMGAVVAVALTAAPATPAFAGHGWNRPGGYYYGDRHWRGRRGGIDAGDVIAGAVIIGAIAAIASAASRNRDDRYPGGRYPGGTYPGGRDRDGDRDRDGRIYGENSAVDACAAAAEDEALRDNRSARVDDITDVSRTGDGYRVEGTLAISRGRYSDKTAFVCQTRDGEIEYVRVDDRDSTAWR